MARQIPVCLEVGEKRVFAGALDWPGWSRSGRDRDGALQALADCGNRYKAAVGRRKAGRGFTPPEDPSAFQVEEEVKGNATTDFGAPGVAPPRDDRPLRGKDLERFVGLLEASWAAFDRAARDAEGVKLSTGPRGGGRDLPKIVEHVLDAEKAYHSKLGGRPEKDEGADVAAAMKQVRKQILDLLGSLARGEPPPRTPRSGSLWTPRYFVRRSAWHALDHAWEIEDRTR